MRLTETDRKVTGQVLSRVGEQTSSQSTNKLLSALDRRKQLGTSQAVKDFNTAYNEKAKEVEKQAVADVYSSMTDTQYKPEDLPEDITPGSIYADVYNQTQESLAQHNLEREIKTRAANLAIQYPDDPQAYQDALNAEVDTFATEQGLDVSTKGELGIYVADQASRYLPQMLQQGTIKQLQQQKVSAQENLQTDSNIALGLLRNGQVSEYAKLEGEMKFKTDRLVAEGILTPAEQSVMMSRFVTEAQEQLIIGDIERILEEGDVNKAVMTVDAWRSHVMETGMMSPDQADQVVNGVSRSIINYQTQVAQVAKSTAGKAKDIAMLNSLEAVDTKNKSQMKALDSVFSSVLTDAEGNSIPFDVNNAEHYSLLVETTAQYKAIPSQALSSLRSAIKSDNPETLLNSVLLVDELKGRTPSIMNQMSTEDYAYAKDIAKRVSYGTPPDQAITEAKEARRQFQSIPRSDRLNHLKDLQGGNEDYAELVEDKLDTFIEDNIDQRFFTDVETTLQIKDDWTQAFNDAMVASNGDEDISTDIANSRVAGVYSKTFIGGDTRIMKHSPEGMLTDGKESEWLKEDWYNTTQSLVENMATQGLTITQEAFTIQPTYDTLKGKAVWRIYRKDSSGLNIPTNMLWKPDKLSTEIGKQEAVDAAEETKALELAKKAAVEDAKLKRLEEQQKAQEQKDISRRRGERTGRSVAPGQEGGGWTEKFKQWWEEGGANRAYSNEGSDVAGSGILTGDFPFMDDEDSTENSGHVNQQRRRK